MRGPTKDKSRTARRFRTSLPAKRVRPTVAGVLDDAVLLAKVEVDRMKVKAKTEALTLSDINRLESLLASLEKAQRIEERVEEEIRDELAAKDDDELEAEAEGSE